MKNDPITPHPLNWPQKLALGALRLGMAGGLGILPRPGLPRGGHDLQRYRYGMRRDETLEILEPHEDRADCIPVIYLHGGGWAAGHKGLYTRDLAFLAQAGHRVYSLDYPRTPGHPFPRALLSALEALSWIRHRHPEIDTVHLVGDSAGGNLAWMLARWLRSPDLWQHWLPELSAAELPQPGRVVSLYGVMDHLDEMEGAPTAWKYLMQTIFTAYAGPHAGEPGARLIAPLDHALADMPPCLIAVGDRDPLHHSSERFYQAVQQAGGDAQLLVYPGERHGFLHMSWRENSHRLKADVVCYLNEQ